MILRGKIILTLALSGLLLSSCGSTDLLQSREGSSPSIAGEALSFQLRNSTETLDAIRGVYVGETVPLELRGVSEEETALWFSLDTTRGVFQGPGNLHLLRAGNFIIQGKVGNRSVSLNVEVGQKRPAPPEDPPIATQETPTPSPSASPSASPEPTPPPLSSPLATPTAEATPSASPQPSVSPSPNPSATPNGSASPLPTPVVSDPYMDEVVSFQSGSGAGFGLEHFPSVVLGAPKGGGLQQGGFDVLSLGAGGSIVLKSDAAILDGDGPDFIVFENAFYAGGNPQAPFAEPGEVSVSQDGVSFVVFPCASGNREEMYPGCAGIHPVLANADLNDIDPTDPTTAGGDAFDLSTLGLTWARYIRIRDLSASGTGNSAGFDLDAIAIVYQ